MKIYTRSDLPAIHMAIVHHWPIESSLTKKWDEVTHKMGFVTTYETIRDTKLVLLLCNQVNAILANEVSLRGYRDTMEALKIVETITIEAQQVISAFEAK